MALSNLTWKGLGTDLLGSLTAALQPVDPNEVTVPAEILKPKTAEAALTGIPRQNTETSQAAPGPSGFPAVNFASIPIWGWALGGVAVFVLLLSLLLPRRR